MPAAYKKDMIMLSKSRTIAFGVASALWLAIAAPGGNHDTERSARTGAATGGFDLTWFTVDGGGGTSSGGDFVLSGTIGQPDAGDLAGGGFTLRGGFWQPVAAGCGDCPTDANGDSETGPFDLATLLAAWGPVEPGNCLDANGDGAIGPFDLATLLAAWGECP